jgi:hypothetical protein
MVSSALILVLCVLAPLAIATPIKVPSGKGFLVQSPAYVREASFENLRQAPRQDGADARELSTSRPAPTINTGSEHIRIMGSAAAEGSGTDSLLRCKQNVIIALVVALGAHRHTITFVHQLIPTAAVSVALNLALFIRLIFLNRRQHELVGIIPLQDVRPVRASTHIAPLPPVQMASTDSTATLVPHIPFRRF